MRERLEQFQQAWAQVRQLDPKLVPWVALGGTLGLVVGVGLGWVSPVLPFVFMPVFGLLVDLLGALLVFNRRASTFIVNAANAR